MRVLMTRRGLSLWPAVLVVALAAVACVPPKPKPAAPKPKPAPITTTTPPATAAAAPSLCGVEATEASSIDDTTTYSAVVRQPDGDYGVVRRTVDDPADPWWLLLQAQQVGDVVTLGPDVLVQAQSDSWGLEAVASRTAWASPLASTGVGVRVAVLDTGLDASHPAFAGRADPGYDVLNGGVPVTTDPSGHGTHVAGIVAAGESADSVGGAPSVTVVPVRVLDASAGGFLSDVIAGILWAADPLGGRADVINLSLGAALTDPAAIAQIDDAVTTAAGEGTVVVAAAGNSSCSLPEYPAASPGALSVAALCQPGSTHLCPTDSPWPSDGYQLATFSSRSPGGVAAPGVDIPSALPGGTYGSKSGTSMAAPFVAATAALVRAHCPSLTVDEIGERIRASAHDLGPGGPDPLYGYGMVDAAAAVDGCFGRASGSAVTVDPAVAPSGTGTAQCADGQVVLGGGVEWTSVPEGAVVNVQSSFPSAPGAWSATATVEDLPATFVVWAACGSAPIGYASAHGELVTAGPLVEDPPVSGSEAEPAIATATARVRGRPGGVGRRGGVDVGSGGRGGERAEFVPVGAGGVVGDGHHRRTVRDVRRVGSVRDRARWLRAGPGSGGSGHRGGRRGVPNRERAVHRREGRARRRVPRGACHRRGGERARVVPGR